MYGVMEFTLAGGMRGDDPAHGKSALSTHFVPVLDLMELLQTYLAAHNEEMATLSWNYAGPDLTMWCTMAFTWRGRRHVMTHECTAQSAAAARKALGEAGLRLVGTESVPTWDVVAPTPTPSPNTKDHVLLTDRGSGVRRVRFLRESGRIVGQEIGPVGRINDDK